MSQRGIKASKEGIAKAEQALTRNSLNKSALARELGLTRQPVSKFFNGKPIERLNFEDICRMLGLEWREIVDLSEQANPIANFPFQLKARLILLLSEHYI